MCTPNNHPIERLVCSTSSVYCGECEQTFAAGSSTITEIRSQQTLLGKPTLMAMPATAPLTEQQVATRLAHLETPSAGVMLAHETVSEPLRVF